MKNGNMDASSAIPNDVTSFREEPQTSARVAEVAAILVTGDSPDQLQELRWLIKDCGYCVIEDNDVNGSTATALMRTNVIVLNFATIPSADPERVEALREKLRKPVLCVLPYPNEQEVARVDRLAADALVFKPLRFEELASRLRLLLRQSRQENGCRIVDRRRSGRRKGDQEMTFRPVQRRSSFLVVNEREKSILCGDRKLQLSRKEYLLLSLLASDPGKTFSKQEIIARLWPKNRRAAATDVQQYICLLRKKIEPDSSNPRLIKTVPAFGYKFVHPDELRLENPDEM